LEKGSIIFHYHQKIYKDEKGGLWMASGQGIWLDELAKNFDKLILLNFETPNKGAEQDYLLQSANIQWVNLGYNRGYFDFLRKRKRIKEICAQWSNKADFLLIRGFTPFQNRIWKQLKVNKSKSYLLVRSLKQPRVLSWNNPFSWISYLANKRLEKRFNEILKSVDFLFTNSKEVQASIKKLHNIDAHFATTNVLRGGDFTFDFKSWDANFNLLFVGRIHPLKGVKELIDAFIKLQKRNPSIKLVLNLVGEGEAQFKDELVQKLQDQGMVNQVVFHGRISFGPQLFDLYKAAHGFVLPSYTEGFPRVVWEAALFSTPIIVTDVGGIPAVIENEKHAVLIPPRDSEALYDALHHMINSKHKFEIIAREAFELALNNTVEKGVEVVYKQLQANNGTWNEKN